MSVHRICEFDPFWTKKKIFAERHSDRQTDGNTHRHRGSNSSLDIISGDISKNIEIFNDKSSYFINSNANK